MGFGNTNGRPQAARQVTSRAAWHSRREARRAMTKTAPCMQGISGIRPTGAPGALETQAGQQVVDLILVGYHVIAALGLDHRAIQQAFCLFTTLGLHCVEQNLQ